MSNKYIENFDQLLKENPDDLLIRVGTNDLMNNVNYQPM